MKHFWGSVLEKNSIHKNSFLKFWANVYPVYRSFQDLLNTSGKAYSGMIFRKLCAEIQKKNFKWENGRVIFAGFNALIPAEEVIIKWFIESEKGEIYWDLDSYYFNNPNHEAGLFFRQYYNAFKLDSYSSIFVYKQATTNLNSKFPSLRKPTRSASPL